MSPWNDSTIDPELVAAYFDGEFEGRDDTHALGRQVEAWLESNPEARALVHDYRRLRRLWRQTAPDEPSRPQWEQLLADLRGALLHRAAPANSVRRPWRWAAVGATAAAVLLGWLTWPKPTQESPNAIQPPVAQSFDDEAFAVAQAHEVVILNVDGADTATLPVGELPLQGPLELATKDEVRVTDMQPDESDNMVPRVRGHRPMIWASLHTDRHEE